VANAILDGTDCVMLSGESAMGEYPVDATAMLAKIAAATEPHRTYNPIERQLRSRRESDQINKGDLIALSVDTTLKRITPPTVMVPTRSGATARRITRFRLPVWITAISRVEKTCQDLLFSYGVQPVCEQDHPDDWKQWARNWLNIVGESGDLIVMTEGPSEKHPYRNNRMEILDLNQP
jgi:pyruvate kinase